MKENKEDMVKYHQRKRRKHKIKLAIISIVFIIIALMIIGAYGIFNKKHTINYKETANVGYSVNLIENEFYKEDSLEEGIDVISSLIKNIDVEFKYNLELEEELEYTYTYKILAKTEVKEKSKTNLIYETQQEVLTKAQQEGKSDKLEIAEKINLDYNEYNNQIKKLIDVYKLANTASELHLGLYLNIINKSTGEQINTKAEVMSIELPLTTKTVEIAIHENVKENEGQIIIREGGKDNLKYLLPIGIVILVIGIITLISLIKYILDTRSAEKMYDDELKKILFDYKGYIQKINNKIEYNDYKIIKIDTFKELLEMREEIQSPILMYTEENNRKTEFIMLSGNLLFEYILGAELIREQLIKTSKDKEAKRNEKNK